MCGGLQLQYSWDWRKSIISNSWCRFGSACSTRRINFGQYCLLHRDDVARLVWRCRRGRWRGVGVKQVTEFEFTMTGSS